MTDILKDFLIDYGILILVCAYIIPASIIILKAAFKKHEPDHSKLPPLPDKSGNDTGSHVQHGRSL